MTELALKQTIQTSQPQVDCLALLRRHAIFGKLRLNHLKSLCGFATRRTVSAGKTIFAKGDRGAAMFAVCSGTVKITLASIDGHETRFNLLHAGDIFGEFALLDGQPRTTDAVAMTDCELTVIKRSDFQTFVEGEPNVALKLIELLATQLSLANLRFEEVVSLTLPMRIALTLLRLADESSSDGGSLRFKQYELAEIVRTTRESINKCLRTWAKRKWIRIERGGIVLINPSALVAIAGGSVDNTKGLRSRPAGRRRRST